MVAETGDMAIEPEALDFLRDQKVVTIATASPTGAPHAGIVLYVNDGVALYFSTRPATATAQHIAQNPFVSFAIHRYDDDWSKMKGIQGAGECSVLLSPEEIGRVISLFRGKFSFLSDLRAANLSFFRISATSLQYIDNERGKREKSGQAFGIDYQRTTVYNVFRDLPRQEVDSVMTKLAPMQLEAGQIVVRQGAPADRFFIITDGEVEVLREDSGVQRAVARLQSGQFFGEMAILRDMPRTATVRAVQPTTLLAMDRDSFRRLVAQSLGTTEDFDQIVQRRWEELASLGNAE